jgi:hypothetical protein
MKYNRNCPKCNKTISVSTKQHYLNSVKSNSLCLSCSKTKVKVDDLTAIYEKTCPSCGGVQSYKNKPCLRSATKSNTLCKKCRSIPENNPFYGKKHTEKTKELLSKVDKSYTKTKEFKDKVIVGMDGNTNRKPYYQCWLEKYGEAEAKRLMCELKTKQSIRGSGKNNHMYGKPSPQGSGNGWSGWFKGWYFRSLRELSYMVNVIEYGGLDWKTTETKEFSIKYTDWDGVERNYFPDFIVNNCEIVEVKPKKLWDTPKVSAKAKAAKIWCSNRGLSYSLVDIEPLPLYELKELINIGKVTLIERYRIKLELYIKNEKEKADRMSGLAE